MNDSKISLASGASTLMEWFLAVNNKRPSEASTAFASKLLCTKSTT